MEFRSSGSINSGVNLLPGTRVVHIGAPQDGDIGAGEVGLTVTQRKLKFDSVETLRQEICSEMDKQLMHMFSQVLFEAP